MNFSAPFVPYNIPQKISGDYMLTVTAAGKSPNEAVNIVKNAVNGSPEEPLKIEIDSPAQAEAVKRFLETQGFSVVPEDDDGTLYLTASKIPVRVLKKTSPANQKPHESQSTLGIIISMRNKDLTSSFLKKFLFSLIKVAVKPNVIALLDSAVKIAAYNSPLCVILKKLETDGVQILISESCADRLGITEAVGAGIVADMAEILDEIFSCSKIVSI